MLTEEGAARAPHIIRKPDGVRQMGPEHARQSAGVTMGTCSGTDLSPYPGED